MTTQTKQLQGLFPDLPRELPVVDKDGNFTMGWGLGFASLFQALQQSFSNEGFIMPLLSASNMAFIESIYTPYINHPLPQELTSGATQKFLRDISGSIVVKSEERNPYMFMITYDASTPPKVSTAGWVQMTMIKTFAGNPNGNVGGALNWLCYDSTGHQLYICVTAGSSNGSPLPQAVWQAV